MSRIKMNDSAIAIIMKMGEGNPGALNALMELMKNEPTVDPQSFWSGVGTMLALDTLGIYGSSIYILFSDKCKKDVRKMIMLLRAHNLGYITAELIQQMAADQMGVVNLTDDEFAELDKKVCAQLDRFKKAD